MAKKENVVTGLFHGNQRGFGFVSAEGLENGDVFIPAARTHGAMHKDEVLCRILAESSEKKRCEGEIVKVIKRGYKEIVGTYQKYKSKGFVVPDEKKIGEDIFIPAGKSLGAVDGHKVVVEITKSDGMGNPEGFVKEILGHINDPGVDVLSIVRQMNMPVEFDREVFRALKGIPEEVSPAEYKNRDDYRNLLMVTIDGEDTKDIDDAVSLEMLESGNYRLGVHIADVSHYVREGSVLDKEAYRRGTSVYLADRVIPMLPHKLSNGICSLNAHVDRLALSCVMELDKSGAVKDHKISQSVINVKKRMTYTILNDLLVNENSEHIGEYADFLSMFQNMRSLADILREKRVKRGAIEFDFPESKIVVDSTGWPVDIKAYQRNIATGIIEEFMLAANETIAEQYFWLELPFVYRSHEEPDTEKMQKLSQFIAYFGYSMKGSTVHPRSIQKLLSKIESTPEETIISRVVLRSFKQARYTPDNQGHFGLAAKYYCHFTSPIRRYPDLQIHRIIKEHLNGHLDESRIEHLQSIMPDVSRQCSVTERTAETCEREVNDLKKAQFMSDKIGKVFSGIISGTTSWGLYVELENTVEGMISAGDLQDDNFVYNQNGMCYEGKHSKKVYRVGDRVQVEVLRVGIQERTIDFLFAEN